MSVTPPTEQPRGIAGIAQLFLSRIDNDSNHPGQHRAAQPCSQTGHYRRLAGITLLADHLEGSRQKVFAFARHWTDKNERVGILNLETSAVELIEFARQPTPSRPATDGSWDELFCPAEPQAPPPTLPNNIADTLTSTLSDLARRCDILLVNIAQGKLPQVRELIELCRHTVVITTCSPADMVETYKTIKYLSPLAWKDMDISLFVCGADDENAARKIHQKLNSTAWEFLGIDLKWAGWEHLPTNVKERILGSFEGDQELLDELAEFLAGKGSHLGPAQEQICESLKEQTDDSCAGQQNISREAERENILSFAAQTPPTPAAGPVKNQSACPAATVPPLETPAGRPIPLTPIGVAQLPRTDHELAQVLQLALPGWLTQLPTVMALPVHLPTDINPAVKILIDANGRLHVFFASLTGGGEILPHALRARKWLSDNLSLIIASCRQIKIDPSLPIGIILVTGGALDTLRPSSTQMGEFPTLVLQLLLLQNNSGSSLLVF